MLLRNSEVNLVFAVSGQRSMDCYREIVHHLVQELCYDFSVSQDHDNGSDVIILSIDFGWSEVLEGIAKIIKQYEEGV